MAKGLVNVGGGGSSGNTYVNAIDKPPATPNAKDDEFNDETLDAKWIWVNQSTATVTESGQSVYLTAPAGAIACRGIVQPAPSGADYTIIAKYLGCGFWGNYSKTGVLISESVTAKQLGIWNAYDSGWKGLMGEFFSLPGTRGTFAYYGPAVNPASAIYIKVRVYQSASVWYVDFYFSYNGVNWITSKTGLAVGFTPAYIGLGVDFEGSGGPYNTYFDWFRVTED